MRYLLSRTLCIPGSRCIGLAVSLTVTTASAASAVAGAFTAGEDDTENEGNYEEADGNEVTFHDFLAGVSSVV